MRTSTLIPTRVAIAFAALVLAATVARAQDTLAIGDHVRLRVVPPPEDPYPRTRWEGTLVRLGRDSVVVRDRRRLRAFSLHDVRRAEVRTQVRSARAGALGYGLRSAIVGAAVGAVAAAAVGGNSDCVTSPGGACFTNDVLPTGGTIAASSALAGLLGAWYGATAGRWGWSRATVARAQ